MVTDTRPTPAVSGVSATQHWERYREDAREAILARLAATPGRSSAGADGRGQAGSPLPSGLVRATVLQAHSDSEALVDIEGRPYLVNTKQALAPGTSVILRLLDDRSFFGPGWTGPRERSQAAAPTTLSGAPNADTSPADETGAVRRTRGVAPTAMPSLAELHVDSGDASVRLSGSARLLLALADQAGGLPRMVPLPPLQGQGDPLQAAEQLRHAVESSGLFYESHLQAWGEGRRSLDALRAEPQAAFSPGTPAKDAKPPAAGAEPELPGTPEQNANRGLHAALAAIPPDVRPLVQHQIALLESDRLALQGSWEGSDFTLEVEPDEQRADHADIPLSWRLRLHVDTPHLGRLELDVLLKGTQTQVTVRPDARRGKAQPLRELKTHLAAATSELQQALAARGLAMSELKVANASRQPAAKP